MQPLQRYGYYAYIGEAIGLEKTIFYNIFIINNGKDCYTIKVNPSNNMDEIEKGNLV